MDPDQRIGDYEILRELGSGGMGRVYQVRNLISDRVEAMKILLPDLVGRHELVERFLREIKLLAAMNHPNIASLRTALTVDNQLIMIMEYVDGQSLAGRLGRGPIEVGDALTYVDQILGALHYAHELHVIHRDIKPANIMLTPQGVVKLMDFGIARSGTDSVLTATGTTTGSLAYMSPEQVKGGPVDARSDLYSLGISLYEMVTGKRPFQSNSDFGVMDAQLNEAPKPPATLQPGLSPVVNDLILKAIAKDPARRFQSAAAFRDAINQARPGSTGPADDPGGSTMTESTVCVALPQDAFGHPRPIVDTRTFSQPALEAPGTNGSAGVGAAPPHRRTHPVIYMLAGAFVLVAALVGATFYIERAGATPHVDGDTGSPVAAEETSVPPSTSGSSTVTPAVPTETPKVKAEPPLPPAAGVKATAERRPPSRPAPVGRTAVTDAAPAKSIPEASAQTRPAETEPTPQEGGKPTADLERVEDEIDQLSARAGAVNNSLNRLQQEQARQGLSVRADMAARQQSMKLNLSRADEAIAQHNAARAQRYKALAEADVEAIERFLGR